MGRHSLPDPEDSDESFEDSGESFADSPYREDDEVDPADQGRHAGPRADAVDPDAVEEPAEPAPGDVGDGGQPGYSDEISFDDDDVWSAEDDDSGEIRYED